MYAMLWLLSVNYIFSTATISPLLQTRTFSHFAHDPSSWQALSPRHANSIVSGQMHAYMLLLVCRQFPLPAGHTLLCLARSSSTPLPRHPHTLSPTARRMAPAGSTSPCTKSKRIRAVNLTTCTAPTSAPDAHRCSMPLLLTVSHLTTLHTSAATAEFRTLGLLTLRRLSAAIQKYQSSLRTCLSAPASPPLT